MRDIQIRPKYGVIFFVGLGFAWRIYQLSFQPLWGDEGWSFYFATHSVSELIALTATDIHPPLYYLLLKGWFALLGVSPESARLLSAWIGTLWLPIVYLLGRRMFGLSVALVATGLTSVMPMAVYYSQEVRMYGLVTLLGLISMYALCRVSDRQLFYRDSPFWTTLYILSTVGALYTMYYAAFILLAQLLYLSWYWLLKNRLHPYSTDHLKRFVYRLIAVALLYLPWVIYATPRLLSYIKNKRDVEGYLPLSPLDFLTDHLTAFSVGHLSDPLLLLGWGTLLFVGLFIVGLLVMGSNYIEGNPFALHSLKEKKTSCKYSANSPERASETRFLEKIGFLGYFTELLQGTNERTDSLKSTTFVANRFSHQRLLYFYFFIPLSSGYLINQIFPFTPPTYERTLLLITPVYWLFIAVGLVWLWHKCSITRFLSISIAMLMLIITLISLIGFYSQPRYIDEDYRPLLADVANRATEQDSLLASYQWQLGFYRAYLPEPRPNIFLVPGWGQGWDADEHGERTQMKHDLSRLLADSPRLWFPAHQTAGRIWEDAAEEAITQLGYPTLLTWYSPQTKLTLTGGHDDNQINQASTANFANYLFMTQAIVGQASYQSGRGIIPLELTWRSQQPLPDEYQVSLRLADFEGRTWAIRDSHPRGGQRRFSQLNPTDTLTDRHGLLVEAGTPPGLYRLLLSLRRLEDAHPLDMVDVANQPVGVELHLADVTIIDPQPAIDKGALPVATQTNIRFYDNVASMVGHSVPDSPFKSGTYVDVNLFWQALNDVSQTYIVQIQLEDEAGQIHSTYQRQPIRPTTDWRRDMLLRDPHEFPIPATISAGRYNLRLSLLSGQQQPLNLSSAGSNRLLDRFSPMTSIILTSINLIERLRIYDAPQPQNPLQADFNGQAMLVGLDMPFQTFSAGDKLPLTLYWHAQTEFDRSWTVFVHLLDEHGTMVAQHDKLPGDGEFPTTSWLPDEYLTDSYTIVLPSNLPADTNYTLSLGFYDANDFSRLPLVIGGEVVGDHLLLTDWPILVK
ncbi:glycosyltransferase family 39 protein [Anaerolineales bacterium HSG24]|nr:glycosyltransferase family 39 protein [Anaerolineales bacterium HSG24]